MKKIETINEINLLEIIQTILNNKMKIFLIVILYVAITFGFQANEANKVKTKKFTTKISAISIIDEDTSYQNINLNIDRISLFELFVKILKTEIKVLVEKSNIIKKENYKDNKTYEVALDKIVSKVIINDGDGDEDKIIDEITIQFSSDNEDTINTWFNILSTLEYSINKTTQEYLKNSINKKLEYEKLERQNQIEDIDRQIENEVKIYLLEKNSRLSFLNEQAKIAREGNVDSDKVTPSSFGSNYSINYNDDNLSLYYMKGYRVIEKEIALIKERKNPYLFAKNIPQLELKKLGLESDQDINREESNLKKTPIFSDSKFIAGLVNYNLTEMSKNKNTISDIDIIINVLIGMIIGIFYVLISSAINNAMKRH